MKKNRLIRIDFYLEVFRLFSILGRNMGIEPMRAGATIRCVNHFTNSAMHKYINKLLLLLQVYIIMLKKESDFMILNVWDDIMIFFDPIIDFFKELWTTIQDFLLQYMSQDVLNILIFGIVVAIVLIVILAIINKD